MGNDQEFMKFKEAKKIAKEEKKLGIKDVFIEDDGEEEDEQNNK